MHAQRARDVALRLAIGLALLAIAYGAYKLRRHFILQFFHDAQHRAAPPELDRVAPGQQPGLAPVQRVRVVLLDGIGRSVADRLPNYRAICQSGLTLTVDVGFPTVSLPIQHALWTGLSQQQAGILFRGKALEQPPSYSIPAQVPDSQAIAESHQYIVASLGFASTQPPGIRKSEIPADWQERFLPTAGSAFTSDTRLAFAHVLRVDVAGHRAGASSERYRQAARAADDILGDLWTAESAAHPRGTRFFVLADHGHRAGGGHGGAEPYIRQVRACVTGELDTERKTGDNIIHLLDLSRAIADSLAVPLPAEARGRPLYTALATPYDSDAVLPSPDIGRWTAGLLIIAIGLLLTALATRGKTLYLPWWLPVAVAAVILVEAIPTLSNPMVYKPHGRVMYRAATPGLLVLAIATILALRTHAPARVVTAQLALPLSLAVACLILCGGGHLLFGLAGDPPLMPRWTAMTSMAGTLCFSAALVVGSVVLASAVPACFGRGGPRETPRSDP